LKRIARWLTPYLPSIFLQSFSFIFDAFNLFKPTSGKLPMSTLLPTVFIPALLCDERLYNDVIASLGDQVNAQVMLSPLPRLEQSVADLLTRAPEKFVLVGTSYGGRLALEIALAAPDRVMALWLMGSDPGAAPSNAPDLAAGLETTPQAVIDMLAGLVVHKDAKGAAAVFQSMAQSVGAAAGAAQARAVALRTDLSERLKELKMPALVLWGEDDALVPPLVGRKLAEDLPNAQLQLLPGCGHLPTLEKPQESAALFKAFLASAVNAAR
jgi:pimeloyl-ACP methyl ester carboxylesterase